MTGQASTQHQLVFLGGLHRSGTTLLAQMLAEHPQVSGLTNTGVPHDEGQHLHNVVEPATAYGGPGHFGNDPRSHLTEADIAKVAVPGERMFAAWQPYFDLEKRILVEKSPPNLLRFRFLQAAFPDAACVAIVRHPVAVAYATEFWAKRPIGALLEHWLHAHEVFERDRPHIKRLLWMRYEDIVADPAAALIQLDEFLGIGAHCTTEPVRNDTNRRYFKRFRHARGVPAALKIAPLVLRYESRLAALGYGYSLRDRGDR